MENIKRIQEMEGCLESSHKAVEELCAALTAYENVQKDLKKLSDYYGSTAWMEDYESDEAGRLPKDLKRGVLSEDTVYDLLGTNHELCTRMLKLVARQLEGKVVY